MLVFNHEKLLALMAVKGFTHNGVPSARKLAAASGIDNHTAAKLVHRPLKRPVDVRISTVYNVARALDVKPFDLIKEV